MKPSSDVDFASWESSAAWLENLVACPGPKITLADGGLPDANNPQSMQFDSIRLIDVMTLERLIAMLKGWAAIAKAD